MGDDRKDSVQLGCGTLILIAIIVLTFSGGNRTDQVASDVQSLRREIVVLQQKVDGLTRALETRQPVEAEPPAEAEAGSDSVPMSVDTLSPSE